ncbi:MAG TPA: hypothetical protein VGO85_16110 [Caldimonas sp.]|nr:hypothetical protein [Caldimonas sp.]
MITNRTLSRPELALALVLAGAWLLGGGAALVLSLREGRWLLVACALVALLYGAAWIRVAVFARPLTWAELVAPWRPRR